MTMLPLSLSQLLLLLALCTLLIGVVVFKKFFAKTSTKKAVSIATFESLTARMGFNFDVVLHVAASLAKASEHRLAQAIVSEAQKRQVPMNTVADFKHHEGYGLTGVVDGRIIALGSHALMQELGIKTQVDHEQISQNIAPNSIVLYISINSYWAGIMTINDTEATSF